MNLQNMIKRLPSNYLKIENSNIYKLFFTVSSSIEELKFLFEKISSWQGIKNAEGETLDLIGQDVRQNRHGLSDEEYRPILRFKNTLNMSGTDINSVNNAMVNITENNYMGMVEGYKSEYKEPASILIMLKDYNKNIQYDRVTDILAAGVRAFIKVEKTQEAKVYIGAATTIGEVITVYPHSVKDIQVKGDIAITTGYNLSYEIVDIYPKK